MRLVNLILCFSLITIWCKELQVFQLYDQNQPVSLETTKEKMNFATLSKSAFVGKQWSLCSSMYVGFVRGRQAFFAVSREDTSEPWFTIYLTLNVSNSAYPFFHQSNLERLAIEVQYQVRQKRSESKTMKG